MLGSPFGGSKPEADHARRVKEWVRSVAPPSAEAHIMVTQVACPDADCPDVETIIAIMEPGAPARRYKIFKSIAQVTQEDVLATITLSDAASHSRALEQKK